MDQIKTGKFIATLRRQAGFTQEVLGDKLGVSNKTISRWENGNYMPDIEMLQLLSNEFNVSINELLSGEKNSNESSGTQPIQIDVTTKKECAFSVEDIKKYFKKKWYKEHLYLLILSCLIIAGLIIFSILSDNITIMCFTPLFAIISYGYINNRMMAYIENKLYK
ncbi:MAG: helix-turn-helix transcriptional regulator [Oscillospiraceae bacterium]|nr:helix-turn-helix transcriptional regulator [Ruminococcus sp.]MBQ9981497.1 helix-turn-helix transcriptional regulator [Oscillospiraceae bacterium]